MGKRRRNPTAQENIRELIDDDWSTQYIVECLITELKRRAKELRAEDPEEDENDEAETLEHDAYELERIVENLDPGG